MKLLRQLLAEIGIHPASADAPQKLALAAVNSRRLQLRPLSDQELHDAARAFRASAAPRSVVEAFALACLAAERAIGLRPFDVQILGALEMHAGSIAEMQTGEGKTLAAVLSAYANALDGEGLHVWTANDYLARRDAAWMGPIYEWLGLSSAFIAQGMTADQRRGAYNCDVTYCTANEVGFDYLRDQLALEPAQLVQRPFAFALIDEADSILIDEARIPLVIAAEAAIPEDLAQTMARLAAGFTRHADFSIDPNARNVQLTDRGIAKVEAAFGCGNLYEPRNFRIFTAAQDALHAGYLLRRDIDYIVRNESIELVDEFKGRVALDRRWPAGLQTALEAKEHLPLRRQGRILGSVTLQNLVGMYPRICGMTGTAVTQAEEFRQVYKLDVVRIPTHKPVIRIDEPDIVYADRLAKELAIVREIQTVHATGRPVLVGTASVEESERISERARQAGIEHTVLNARHDETEARIVARAGALGAVTISTNMAGRGTDIPLGGEEVRARGGLYVIGTNKHESRRIDNQLRGRAGRQGDPGSSRFFVSIEDDLMERYGIREVLGPGVDPVEAIGHVQRIVESQNLEIRKTLWKYEGLIEQHRTEITARRRDILLGRPPALVETADPERWQEIVERWGEARARAVERAVTLTKIDDIWSDYLAAISELRGGIHWVSWTGKDPLHSFLIRANEIFDEVEARIAEEVQEAMSDDGVLERGGIPDAFERGATWTYLINDQPFGTMAERWVKSIVTLVRRSLGR